VSWTEYYAGWTTKLLGDTIPVSLPGQYLNYTVREPLGVVAGITPPRSERVEIQSGEGREPCRRREVFSWVPQ